MWLGVQLAVQMDVLEEYVKIEKLDPTQVPDSAVKHKEDSFGKMTSEFSAVESSGKQFIKDATDVCAPDSLHCALSEASERRGRRGRSPPQC